MECSICSKGQGSLASSEEWATGRGTWSQSTGQEAVLGSSYLSGREGVSNSSGHIWQRP